MFLLSAAQPVTAAANLDTLDRGPKIGASVGQFISASDQGSQHRDFKSLARRRGLIILFARSFDW
ncbi:MAG: hypothetical protein HQ514_13480 [Rhodospirillales bacterium]|nr:hypothetical protein [Rhodospirillales bacterium]